MATIASHELTHAFELQDRIRSRTARIAVVGLGYVGLPTVRAVHCAGYRVIGLDTDERKVQLLRNGQSYLKHLGEDLVHDLAASDRFEATGDPAILAEADVVILCVPTPLGSHGEPDLSFVLQSSRVVSRNLHPGQLVILTSTTYPRTTREEVLPILEESGLECGLDFFLAYSPEREDPGRTGMTTSEIPRLVGGVDEASTNLAAEFLSSVVKQVHAVVSTEVAEAAKLLENIYRAVNIALVNELKLVLTEMDIDVWKVIEAAATKPFGFQPFYPGPGLGGHCIPIDPFYLTWKAKEVGLHTRFIELAGEINTAMPGYVVKRVAEALNWEGKAIKGSSILVLGVAYKRNVEDMRETPAAEIIERLTDSGARVCYHDPHVAHFPTMRRHEIELESVPLSPGLLATTDCVVVVTDHDDIDWECVAQEARLIVDTRNRLSSASGSRGRLVSA